MIVFWKSSSQQQTFQHSCKKIFQQVKKTPLPKQLKLPKTSLAVYNFSKTLSKLSALARPTMTWQRGSPTSTTTREARSPPNSSTPTRSAPPGRSSPHLRTSMTSISSRTWWPTSVRKIQKNMHPSMNRIFLTKLSNIFPTT